MIYTDEKWTVHWDKAEKALSQARFLRDSGMFDGAYTLALGSCLQAAKAISLRLRGERDYSDYLPRLRQCFKDGRLPADLANPFFEIVKAHTIDLTTSRERDAAAADGVIELVGTVQRALRSASDLTASHYSPSVMKVAAARGIAMPPTPFKVA
jgi:hypothetical protein